MDPANHGPIVWPPPQRLDQDLAYYNHNHNPYYVHIRRLSAQYDPMMIHGGLPDMMPKPTPMLQLPIQPSYSSGWQSAYYTPEEHRHWSPLSRVSSSSGFDNSCSPPNHAASMSPAMATEVLANMVREQDLFSSPVSLAGAYDSMPLTASTNGAAYATHTPPAVATQPYSMRDFERFSEEDEEPPLIDAEELYASQTYHHHRPQQERVAEMSALNPVLVVSEDNQPQLDIFDGEDEGPAQALLGEQAAMHTPVSMMSSPAVPVSKPVIKASSAASPPATLTQPRTTLIAKSSPRKHTRSPSSSSSASSFTPTNTGSRHNKKRRTGTATVSATARSITSPATTNSANKIRKPLLPCPFHAFGCPAIFPSKNEWKRHALSQHLRLGFYRCSLGTCSSTLR